jgi:hypothetical protein
VEVCFDGKKLNNFLKGEIMTNKDFSRKDSVFFKACELADTDSTPRQASKFRMGKGIAFKFKHKAANIISGQKD